MLACNFSGKQHDLWGTRDPAEEMREGFISFFVVRTKIAFGRADGRYGPGPGASIRGRRFSDEFGGFSEGYRGRTRKPVGRSVAEARRQLAARDEDPSITRR